MFKISIRFIILLIASYLFALVQGGGLPYSIFHGLLLTFCISLLYILSKQKNVKIQVKFDKKVYSAGDDHEFTTIVKNYGILPVPYVIIKNAALSKIDNNYNGDALWLNSDESKWIKSIVRFNQRGIYNFGEININISDLFNIFESNRRLNLSVPVKVYPKIYELDKFIANGSDIFKNAVSSKSSIEDQYSIRDIRKYNEGDNLKRVNWKVSAKHGVLYVRNLDTVSGEESNVFLDMSKENMNMGDHGIGEEQIVDLAASLVNYMNLKGIKTKLFVNNLMGRRFDIDNKENFNELMEFFITQKSDGENNFSKILSSNINKLPRLSWIGIIVNRVSRELKETLIDMKDKGYNITVFYCAGSLNDLSNIQILKKIGINCYSFNEMVNRLGSKVKI